VGPGGDLPDRAASPQQLFDKRLTDPKEGDKGELRAGLLVISSQNVLSEVAKIGLHALKTKPSSPYVQSKTALNPLWQRQDKQDNGR
jgi:hypothetical protein